VPALLGTGAVITFQTSNFTADITEFAFSRISRKAVRTTHFRTPQATAGTFGGHTWMPVKLVDPGYLTLSVSFNPQRPPPINGDPEPITITYPVDIGYATPARWSNLTGFVTDWRIGIPLEGRMTASVEIKLSGLVTQTAGTLIDPSGSSSATTLLACLRAYWALGEATAATREDSHINNLDLADNNGVTQVAGKVGNGAGFALASSQSLTLAGASASLLSCGNADFTITAWVKLTDLTATYILVSKGTPLPSTNSMEYQLAFNSTTGGRWQFLVGNGVSSGQTQHATAAIAGTWVFLVGRHDAAANTVTLTLNDPTVLPATASWSGGSYNSGLDFAIGKYGGFAGGYANAVIDEVGVFNCVLTDAEILHLYNGGAGRTYPFT
jgi:hypothetical protein